MLVRLRPKEKKEKREAKRAEISMDFFIFFLVGGWCWFVGVVEEKRISLG